MPTTLTCTGCRAPIAVPKDHTDPTIRCGICWAEVALAAKPAPLPVAQALPPKAAARPVAALVPPPPPKAAPRPSVVATPTKVAAGMGKLEAMIHKAGAKLAAPPAAAPVAAAVPLVATAVPALVVQPKAAPVVAAPVPVPQAPVPTPVPVPSSQPVIEIQPIPTAAAPPVVVPVALNAVPVVAPVPIPVEPAPAPLPVPVTPASPPAHTTPDGAPIVAGEFADDPPKSARRGEKDRPYKRRDDRRRYDDDEDEDDDRRRPRRAEGNQAAMIGLIVGGVAVFVGLCVGGYYLTKALRGGKTDPAPMAVGPNNAPDPAFVPPAPPLQFDPPAVNPNPVPFPNMPQPNFPVFPNVIPPPPNVPGVPGFQPKFEWTEYTGDGYKAKVVARPTEGVSHVRLHDDNYFLYVARGKQIRAATTPPAATVEVSTADVPQGGMTADLKKIAADPFGKPDAATACKVNDKDGWELVEQRGTQVITTRVVQVGCRVFVFKFTAWDAFGDKDTIDAAKKTFFDSIVITFEATTPAPVDPNARPKRNRVGPRADGNPAPAAPAPPANRPFPGQDSLKLAVRIDPFLAAVTFPDKGEAFTVGLRGNKAGVAGELRRYEYPGFKLKNTYFLPLAGTFAVGSDKTNRLAITTMAKPDGYADGERSIVPGDVQVFDLRPIFDDKVAQREELKPLATIPQPTGTRLAGLEVSPDGTTAYFLTLGRTAKANKMAFRVHRADLVAGKATGVLDLPDAAWRLRLSADGAKLYAAEVPLNAAGNLNALPNRATNVVTIDVGRWQVERTDQLAAGTALDFVPAAPDAIVASVLGANAYSLWAVRPGAPAAPLDPPGEPPTSLGYVAATPDGKRLITSSAGRFAGELVEVYDVTDWREPTGFRKIASARLAKLIDQPGEPGVKVGHNFEVTPDGKYALFCETGAVVDLGAIKAR